MFSSLKVIRERWFETSWFMMQPPQVDEPRGLLVNHGYVSVAGNGTQGWAYKMGLRWLVADMRRAMGIDWMRREELSQAIPPRLFRVHRQSSAETYPRLTPLSISAFVRNVSNWRTI